jgi:hypothetical protein
MKKNPKDLSLKKITNMMMLNQVRNEEKERNPNTGGTIDHFKNNFK